MCIRFFFFFFNDTATTEIYTLSLHDALPISGSAEMPSAGRAFSPDVLERLAHRGIGFATLTLHTGVASLERSEEHTSELQSRQYLVCRLLLEKKKKLVNQHPYHTQH